jgi:hypothetical protein
MSLPKLRLEKYNDSNLISYREVSNRNVSDYNFSDQLRYSNKFQFRNRAFPLRQSFNPKKYYSPAQIGSFSDQELKAMFRSSQEAKHGDIFHSDLRESRKKYFRSTIDPIQHANPSNFS